MSNPESQAPCPSSPSDQIGIDEIKRRVDAAIGDIFIQRPADAEWPSVREVARLIAEQFDEDVVGAIYREGLIRIVRRVMRARNKAKQRKGSDRAPSFTS
jgi:hypothetical protein